MRASALFLVAILATAGCGYTLRAGIGPTLDSEGNPGVMARVEAGIAFPLSDRYSFDETAGWSAGAGAGYGDEDPPAAVGLLVGLDVLRESSSAYDMRFGPTFRVEGPTGGEGDQGATFAAGARVALLKVLRYESTAKRWTGSESEKGGFSVDYSWETVRHLSLEASAELLWRDPRGERVRFGLLIGYEKTGLFRP